MNPYNYQKADFQVNINHDIKSNHWVRYKVDFPTARPTIYPEYNTVRGYYSFMMFIVTHRVITKLLECALLGLDDSHFQNIEQDTCGVTTFLYNGRTFVLKYHNDISFLKNH